MPMVDNVQSFSHIFLRLARSSSPLPEIRPSWEAFAHPRSGCLLWFLVTKRILSTHETSSHEDSAPAGHFRRAGARASKCPAGRTFFPGRNRGKASLCPPTAEDTPRYWMKRIPCRRSTSAGSERSRIRLLPVSMRPMASMSSSSRAKSVTERFSCSLSA